MIRNELEEVKAIKDGVCVQIVKWSYEDIKQIRATVPFTCDGKKLILTGRGFNSPGIAWELTKNGGDGFFWETIFDGQKVGMVESRGLSYWGMVTEEHEVNRDDEPQPFSGA